MNQYISLVGLELTELDLGLGHYSDLQRKRNTNEGNVAVAEIAGKDSIAAAILALKNDYVDTIVPVFVLTGSEYGNWTSLKTNVEHLQNVAQKMDGKNVYDPIIVHDFRLWNIVNAKYMNAVFKKFGFYSPCIGCHMYVHLLRIPIAKLLGATKIISGERLSHSGRTKLNQLSCVISAFQKMNEFFGIEIVTPLLHVASAESISEIIGENGTFSVGDQLKCVLSGNYYDANKKVEIEKEKVSGYCDNFVLPVMHFLGKKLIDRTDNGEFYREVEEFITAQIFQQRFIERHDNEDFYMQGKGSVPGQAVQSNR